MEFSSAGFPDVSLESAGVLRSGNVPCIFSNISVIAYSESASYKPKAPISFTNEQTIGSVERITYYADLEALELKSATDPLNEVYSK